MEVGRCACENSPADARRTLVVAMQTAPAIGERATRLVRDQVNAGKVPLLRDRRSRQGRQADKRVEGPFGIRESS